MKITINRPAIAMLIAKQEFTQQDLLNRSGIAQKTLNGILNGTGKPRIKTLGKLATALGVEVSEFVTFE